MTQDNKPDIRSIAIIGSGAAGLTTLFELLHTKKDGSTTIPYNANGELDTSKLHNADPAFTKIVSFEQKSTVGGIWSPSFDTPDVVPQQAFDTEKYDDPFTLKPKTTVPADLADGKHTFEDPLLTDTEGSQKTPSWSNSGIYPDLYSNVPRRYLRTSFIPYNNKTDRPAKTHIDPLITNSEITEELLDFVKRFELEKYVRLDSEIVDVSKPHEASKWTITVKQVPAAGGRARWYTEEFDAVVVSTGHYSVPYVPRLKGLSSWNAQFGSSAFHSKSFRDPQIFQDKKCLFVGTGLSGVDILQYAFPIAKEVIVSRSTGKQEIFEWLTKAATSEGTTVKPRVKELKPDNNRRVVFEDGTSVDSVDYIIFSTGYHWHYPFLSRENTGVSVTSGEEGAAPNGSSMVDGLYLNTFCVNDPSLAFVGVTSTSFKWPSFEATASAIAGVWSGSAALPPKSKQLEQIEARLEKTGKNALFHYYKPEIFSEYIGKIAGYLPKGRSADNIFDTTHLDEVKRSFAVAERLFYQLKNGEISVSDTV